MKKEIIYSVKTYINRLKKNKINSYSEIPDEYHNEKDIINITRKLGLRKITKCGYDVITKNFFVEESIIITNYRNDLIDKKIINIFTDFQTFFNFLEGDIYENACYYQYNFTTEIINKFQLDTNKINAKPSLSYSVDDILPEPSTEEKEEYNNGENQVLQRKKWIENFNDCTTFEEFKSVIKKHDESNDNIKKEFYIWNYINHYGEKAFNIIMEYVCTCQYPDIFFVLALCFLYGKNSVLEKYNYIAGEPSKNKKHNNKLKKWVNKVFDAGVTNKTVIFFDKTTHYYCIKNEIYSNVYSYTRPITILYKYFDAFNELAVILDNNLLNCDLSNDIKLNIDLSLFKIDNTTKLPIHLYSNLEKGITKRYNRTKSQFEVIIAWYSNNVEVYNKKFEFKYFFEFVSFLNNDLSDADLLFCDGLKNINDFSAFNLKNARIQSSIAPKIGQNFNIYAPLKNKSVCFLTSSNNETETSVIFKTERKEITDYSIADDEIKIYYITDLHLLHRIHNAKCVTYDDCVYTIQTIIDSLLKDISKESLILIAGDVTSEFWIYKLFIKFLHQTIDELELTSNIIFTLGNHELWEFQGKKLDIIIEEYSELIFNHNMYLLHNNILYLDKSNNIICIPNDELNKLACKELREKLRLARIILFGGIGFSGYNQFFNANNGIYRSILSREDEIAETRNFEVEYDKICDCLPDKNIIILTHMPFTDWHKNNVRQNKFVYVSGHDHKNEFYDDGVIRIYSDNQIGYHTEHPKLKYFNIENIYDFFSDYKDGIHTITREDYINFCRGKNIRLLFNRDINKLYMLKKNNFYCFIHESSTGRLTILNGGSMKSLNKKDIQWYYDNMDAEISYIKKPFDQYHSFQLQLSKSVKQIGGSGVIHGAIIDIDFFNHIFVNPNDYSVTPYYALDIIRKYVYPDIPTLLKDKSPLLYDNYNKLLSDKESQSLVFKRNASDLIVKPEFYSSTDIYSISRQLKKIQKLNQNILSTWVNEHVSNNNDLPPEKNTALIKPKKEKDTNYCGDVKDMSKIQYPTPPKYKTNNSDTPRRSSSKSSNDFNEIVGWYKNELYEKNKEIEKLKDIITEKDEEINNLKKELEETQKPITYINNSEYEQEINTLRQEIKKLQDANRTQIDFLIQQNKELQNKINNTNN